MPRELPEILQTVSAAWWLAFFAALGLCLGSFLNVVIYRIPRGISLSNPRWSFCPACQTALHWYDNLPVYSFVRLGGKCRYCAAPISLRYPVVEMLGALLVLLLFDAFFIAHTHIGLPSDWPGLTWQLSQDWPIFLAHVLLFVCLLGMSAIDIEHYWVDVRLTTGCTAAGFLLHALWTPETSMAWPRPGPLTGPACLGAAVVAVVCIALARRFIGSDANPAGPDAGLSPSGEDLTVPATAGQPDPIPAQEPGESSGPGPVSPPEPVGPEHSGDITSGGEIRAGSGRTPARVLALVTGAVLLLLVILSGVQASGLAESGPLAVRWGPVLLLYFLLIVVTAAPSREVDGEIMEAIESERHNARRMVLGEALILLPVLITAVVLAWYFGRNESTQALAQRIVHFQATRDWQPIYGLATAATGFIIAGGIGWTVRITTSLLWGRETFGTGDIHMMAAAGCVAGWPVVLIGFVLSSFLALAGWLLTLPLKRTRAIPLGPWLSLSFLIVVLCYDPIMRSQVIRNMIEAYGQWPVIFGNFTVSR